MFQIIDERLVIADPARDNVAIALADLGAGTAIALPGSGELRLASDVRRAWRVATCDLPAGALLRQFGFAFGTSRGIRRGEAVTGANLADEIPAPDRSGYAPPSPLAIDPRWAARTFSGFARAGGGAGTRNHYLIVPTSMCASETAVQIAAALEQRRPAGAGLDDIVAIPHTEGCGCAANQQIERVLGVLLGFVRHANVGGVLVVDLGCEQTNRSRVNAAFSDHLEALGKPIDWLTIQECGGAQETIERALALAQPRLETMASVRRETCPASTLVLGTECGASDSFSGLTANPAIGGVADRIIRAGGSALLSEVPEMLGTSAMLLPRFASLEVADAFEAMIAWYRDLAAKLGVDLSDNLVPKNREGGLLNSYLKSLGAVMKGGTTPIVDVLGYGAEIRRRGLNIMQGPGGDLESVTGLVASGANIICFSTGKGTITGSAICPVVKISSNSALASRMPQAIDRDAGILLARGVENGSQSEGFEPFCDRLCDFVLETASGRKTWAERWRQRQFQIWTAGKLSL